MKNKILVTGGAGYIGSHTVRYLCDKGYDVIVVDNLIYGHKEAVDARALFIQADLADKRALDQIFDTYDIDAVVHFAAFAYVGESVVEPEKYYFNNVVGTLHLLKSMKEHHVNKIVFSSTCATYGKPQYLPIDEKHPQNPINPYGQTKLIIEKIFESYHQAYGLKYIALRYFNAAGAQSDMSLGESHHPETHLIPLVLKTIRAEHPVLKVFGTDYDTPDGTCIRDYIHVEDLASAHYLALTKFDEYVGCINLGTGKGCSIKEIINAAEEISAQKCKVEYVDKRPGDPSILIADNKKAQHILGWTPQYKNIKDIIRTAWDWECHKKY